MNSWKEGYVSDVEYLPGFYLDQTPAYIDTVCLLRNVELPTAAGEPFRYCELGCGVGETALAIAAASRRSEVWGFDFNPAHIARGRQLARAGGLRNIRLEDASFDMLARQAPPDLPTFDYIALHGVWSWVSKENRAHIVRFIDRYLKPGGAAYVTYNALPGWNDAVPLQRLIWDFSRLDHKPSDRRVATAIEMVRRFADAGSPNLPARHVEQLEKERDRGNLSYLSHEYLNEHWSPCFQADVAHDLAAAKLDYVGTANILENFPDLSLRPEQRALIDEAPPGMRETLKDYFMDRTFRRDVFIRGPRTIPDRRRADRLRQQRLMLVIPPKAVRREIKIPLGEATLSEDFYAPALAALVERGILSVDDILDLPRAAASTVDPREIIGMLVGSRQAMPVAGEVDDEARAVARAYNANHLAACADDGRAVTALAAPALGSAVTVTVFEMLAYEALAAGVEAEPEVLTDAVWKLLQQRGDKLRFEGVIADDEGESRKTLRENMDKIVSVALPLWRRLGAI